MAPTIKPGFLRPVPSGVAGIRRGIPDAQGHPDDSTRPAGGKYDFPTKGTEQPQGRPLGSNADPGVKDHHKTGSYQR